ncbi:MAG: zinc ribbon domain-containing protein [Deltaproteobacteria bacterium]|nr:MAG: zinc ribbon domain-containing protein [Deltaproteobacteria bacterium]
MPIYEYRCEGCGHQLEKLQAFSDDPLTKCPVCAEDLLKRLISQTSFHLKGSGWYVTDYKKSGGAGSKPSAAASSASDSGSSSATSTSTSTSSAGKSDTAST